MGSMPQLQPLLRSCYIRRNEQMKEGSHTGRVRVSMRAGGGRFSMRAIRITTLLISVWATLPAVWGQAPAMANGSGLTVISQQTLDNRLYQVQVSTAALPGPAGVRILLPADYN